MVHLVTNCPCEHLCVAPRYQEPAPRGRLHLGRTHGTPLSAAHTQASRGGLLPVPFGVLQPRGESLCSALASLTGNPVGGKRAAEAGALPHLVRAVKILMRAGTKALLNIASIDQSLLDAAKEAGAKDEWLLAPAEGGEEEPVQPDSAKGSRKQLNKDKSGSSLA